MNEEEVLNEIDFCLVGEYITSEHREAIEGLLSLYQQEKEKSKKLEEQRNELAMILSDKEDERVELNKVIDIMAKKIKRFKMRY